MKRGTDNSWSFLSQFFLHYDPCRKPKKIPPRPKVPQRPHTSVSSVIRADEVNKNSRREDMNLFFRRSQTPEIVTPRNFLTLESEISVTSRSPSRNAMIFDEEDVQLDTTNHLNQVPKSEDSDNTEAISMEKAVYNAARVLNQITRENTPRISHGDQDKVRASSNRSEQSFVNEYVEKRDVTDCNTNSMVDDSSRHQNESQSNTLVAKTGVTLTGQSNTSVDQQKAVSNIPLSPQGNNNSGSFLRRKKRRMKYQEIRSHSALAEILCTPGKNQFDDFQPELEIPDRIKQFNPRQLRSLLGLQDNIDSPKTSDVIVGKPIKLDSEEILKKEHRSYQNKEKRRTNKLERLINIFEGSSSIPETSPIVLESSPNVIESSPNALESAPESCVRARKSGSRRPRTKHRNSADYTASHDSGISADLSSNKFNPSTSTRNTGPIIPTNHNLVCCTKVQRFDVPPEMEFVQQNIANEATLEQTTDDLDTKSGTTSGSLREATEGPFRKNVFVEAAEIRREFYGHDRRGTNFVDAGHNSFDSESIIRDNDVQRMKELPQGSVRVPLGSLSAPQTPVRKSQKRNHHYKNTDMVDDPTISDSDNHESEVKDFLNTFLTITQPLESSTPRVSPHIKTNSDKRATPQIFATDESEATDDNGSSSVVVVRKETKYTSRKPTEKKYADVDSSESIIFADTNSNVQDRSFLDAEAKVMPVDSSKCTSASAKEKVLKNRPRTPVLLRKNRAKIDSSDELIKFEKRENEGSDCDQRPSFGKSRTADDKNDGKIKVQDKYEIATSEKPGTDKDEISSKSYGSNRLNFSIDDIESKVRDKVNDWITRNQNSEDNFSTNENHNNSFTEDRKFKGQVAQVFSARTMTSETGIQCSLLDTTPEQNLTSNENACKDDVISTQATSLESKKCSRTEANKKKLRKLIEELENEKIPENASIGNNFKLQKSSQDVGDIDNSSRSSIAPINIHIENIHVEMSKNQENAAEKGSLKLNGETCKSKEVEKLVMAILEDKGFKEKIRVTGNLEQTIIKELEEKLPTVTTSSREVSSKCGNQGNSMIKVPRLEITPRSPVHEMKPVTSWDGTPVCGMSREPTFADIEWQEGDIEHEEIKTPFNATFVKSSEGATNSKRQTDEMKELMYSDDYEMTPKNRSKTVYMKSEIGGICEKSANLVFMNSLRSSPKPNPPPVKRVSKSPKAVSKVNKYDKANKPQGVGGISTEVADMTFFKSLREMKKSSEEKAASRFRSKTPQPEVSKSVPVSTRARAKTPDFIRQNIQSVSKNSRSKSLQSSRENLADINLNSKPKVENHQKNDTQKSIDAPIKINALNDVTLSYDVTESYDVTKSYDVIKNHDVMKSYEVKDPEKAEQVIVQSADMSESTTDMVKSNVFDSVDNSPKTAISSFEPKSLNPETDKSTDYQEGVSHTSIRSMKRRSNNAKKTSKIPLFKSPVNEISVSNDVTKSEGHEKVKAGTSSRARSLTPKARKDTRENRSKSRIAVPATKSSVTV